MEFLNKGKWFQESEEPKEKEQEVNVLEDDELDTIEEETSADQIEVEESSQKNETELKVGAVFTMKQNFVEPDEKITPKAEILAINGNRLKVKSKTTGYVRDIDKNEFLRKFESAQTNENFSVGGIYYSADGQDKFKVTAKQGNKYDVIYFDGTKATLTEDEIRRWIRGESAQKNEDDNPHAKAWYDYAERGGSFAKHLGNAFYAADRNSLKRLATGFPEIAKKFALWKTAGRTDNVEKI